MRIIVWCASFIVLLFIGVRYSFCPFFSCKNYNLIVDDFLSDDVIKSCNQHLSVCTQQGTCGEIIIAQLKEQFPCIKNVTINYQYNGTVVKIASHEPMCVVNDLLVVTADHELFAKSMFCQSALSSFPAIFIEQKNMSNVVSLASSVVSSLPQDMWHDWAVYCSDEHSIRLVDKRTPQFAILCCSDQKISSHILHACETIKNSMSARFAGDVNGKWVADTRFAHYVVMYKT